MMFYYTIEYTGIVGSNVSWKAIENWTTRICQEHLLLNVFLFTKFCTSLVSVQ